MSNKSLLALLLLLVFGGAVWMWTSEGGAPDRVIVDPLHQQSDAADPRSAATSASALTEAAAQPEARAEVSERQLVDARPEAQPTPELDDDLILTVVERATGAPVAGAVVSVLRTGGSGPNATLSGLLMTGLENTLRLNPQNVMATAESNADGIVRLPASAGSEVIVAQWQGQHGLTLLEWGYDMGTTIRVAGPTELRFRFVDDLGQPVPDQKLTWSDSKLPRDLSLFWRPRTNNVVLIREAASLMAPLVEHFDGRSFLNVSAAEALDWKAPTVVDLRVDRDVNVRALTSASVRVALVDAVGLPVETRVTGPMTLHVDGDSSATRVESVGPDGRAEFRGVPIGANVRVQLRHGGEQVRAAGVVAKDGLDLQLEVVPEVRVTLRAQLVDETGALMENPIAKVFVAAAGGTVPASNTIYNDQSVDAGWIEFSSLDWHRQLESGATLDVQFRAITESGTYESEALLVTQATLGNGNLGAVTMALKPDLVRGRVVDSQGRPVAGARLSLTTQMEPGWSRPVSGAYAEPSAADGSFRVTGLMPDGEVWLSAQLGLDRQSRPQRVERYASDIDVVLLHLASVEFSIDPNMRSMSNAYVFEVVPEEDSLRIGNTPMLEQELGSFSGGWKHGVPTSGSMTLRSLLPGLYTFQLKLKKTDEIVEEWPHIELHEGETLHADNMQNVPIAAQGELVNLVVAKAQGVRVLDFVLLTDNGTGSWSQRRISTPEFLVDAFPTLAIVKHKGYLLEPVVIDAPEVHVSLQPEFDVTLRFPSGLVWPAGTRAQLMPIDVYSVSSTSGSTPGAPWTQGEPTIENGLVTLKVTSAGQHWVALCLPQKPEDVGWQIRIDRQNHPTLTLEPSQAGTVIDVTLTQAELDALLALE